MIDWLSWNGTLTGYWWLMEKQKMLDTIRTERRNGELLGPLISKYGAAAVVDALGVMQLASDMGVAEPLDHCQTCGTPIGCGTCQGCVAYSACVAQEDYPEDTNAK